MEDIQRSKLYILAALREQLRERFTRKEIAELEAVGCRYRLRLKTGELYMASLTEDYQLQLDSVDEAC